MAEYNETDYSGYDVTGAEADAYGPIESDDGDNDPTIDYSGYGNLTGPELARLAADMASNAGTSGFGLKDLADLAKRLMSGKGSASEYGGLASILAGLYSANKSSGPTILNPGYQGGIPKYTATRQMLTAPPAGRRPGSGGINYGGDVVYTRAPSTGGPGAAPSGDGTSLVLPSPGTSQTKRQLVAQDDPFYQSPEYKAFRDDPSNMMGTTDMYMSPYFGQQTSGSTGRAMDRAYEQYLKNQQPMHTAQPQGLPSLATPQQKFEMFPPGESDYRIEAAKGGLLPDGFVVPADVVSHLGNGSSEAGLKILASKFGARPIRGSGDGMSDSIPTTIGGEQPARVANEEAFIPPSVVKRLGSGDTDRGAKKLYAMMDRIRKARTGTTEQGKEINPEKFMPGGKVSGYQTGGAITTNPSAGLTSSSLASWVGPYVADMLGKGQALSEAPYQAYTGPLTAGPSALEQQAFGAASTFQPSAAIGQAAQTAGGIAAAAQGMGYTPATFGNQFTAPGAYQTGTFGTDTFGTQQAQQYMNPYLQSALDPQMKEMQRQADIQRAADAARLTKAGAYGGSRQAIMEAEGRRNLLGKQAEVLGQGYATAYDKAQQAFAQDQARRLEAQRATEASRQFGAGQGLTSAQLAAQYGLSGQQAAEASRQFGSELGLRGLQTGLQAAQAQGNLGGLQTQYGLEGLRTLASLGGTQRGIEAEGIAADKAQFEEARLNPFKMLQFQQSLLSGLPLASQSLYQPGQSNLQQFASGATTVQKLLQSLGIIK